MYVHIEIDNDEDNYLDKMPRAEMRIRIKSKVPLPHSLFSLAGGLPFPFLFFFNVVKYP